MVYNILTQFSIFHKLDFFNIILEMGGSQLAINEKQLCIVCEVKKGRPIIKLCI